MEERENFVNKGKLSDLDDILMTEECEDAIDPHDAKDADAHVANIVEARKEVVKLKDTVSKKIVVLRTKLKQKRSKKHAPVKFPRAEDNRVFTEDLVRTMVPPGAKIKRVEDEGRWRCYIRTRVNKFAGPWRTMSRAWGLWGDRGAVEQLLQWAWHDAKLSGETCHVDDLAVP